ncbi:MAG: hydroxyacylglutathione hydrolase [Alphaproteobacteria bacterium]|nr:hydroxyacylglutathione hydrolase [Alphaproteobacteria bacterium]
MKNITLIPALSDNYIVYFETNDGLSVIVDPGDASPVENFLKKKGEKLDVILNTHHHYDHTDGNLYLKDKYGAELWGPVYEKNRIRGMDKMLEGNVSYKLGGEALDVIHTPGHTSGHICFYFPQSSVLFAGDTLFSLGCGRVFEGSMEEMHSSLQKLNLLPDDTAVYCGHEYTLSNVEFATFLHPDDHDLREELNSIQKKRDKGSPTIPSSLAYEKRFNPFLKAKTPGEFSRAREAKDNF